MKDYIFFIVISIVFSKKFSYTNNSINLLINNKNLKIEENNSEKIEINEDTTIIEIKNDKSYLFHITTQNIVYFYESEIEKIFQFEDKSYCNKTCYISNNEDIYVNLEQNLTKNIIIKINSYKLYQNQKKNEIIEFNEEEKIYFIKNYENDDNQQIMYINSYDSSFKFYLAEYTYEITPFDILLRNETFFNSSLGKIINFKPGVTYILIMDSINLNFKIFSYIYFDIFNGKNKQEIEISNNKNVFLYLKKGVEYNLNFKNNMNLLIKLSKISSNSTVEIKNNNKNYLLLSYSTEYYIKIDKNDTQLTFISKEKDSFIEFSYLFDEINKIEINLTESSTYELKKGNNLLSLNQSFQKLNFINILLESNENFDSYIYSGFSFENYVYYSNPNDEIKKNNNNTYLYQIRIPNEELLNDEYFNILIKIDKDIKMTITYSLIYENLLEKMIEYKCNSILDNIIGILNKTYIYTDIVKNPPQPQNYPDYFIKFDLLNELKEIKRNNRNKYEFYIDIKRVLGKLRDLHLSIIASDGWEYVDFYNSFIYYPFSYIIKNNNINNKPRLLIKIENRTLIQYNESVQNFLMENKNYPLNSINNLDPFDFVQNFGNDFMACKNEHCSFSFKFESFGFYLLYMPFTKKEISNIKFEFEIENEKKTNIVIDFKIQLSLKSDNKIKNIFKFEKKKSNKFNIHTLKHEYIQTNNNITWDYNDILNNYFKCRVDNNNQVNVFVQNSFHYKLWNDFEYAMDLFYNCSELFYSNDYPIIGIQNNNGGGFGILGVYLSQLLQINIDFQVFGATKSNNHTISFLNEDEDPDNKAINITTCEKVDKEILFQGIEDNYGENEDIIHYRTPIYSLINKTEREKFENDRKKLFNKKHTKKPTDIIIFTDGFSYSTTSVFIKGLQNVGGAIIVGYKGNPNLKDKEKFDASQAPSPVYTFPSEPEVTNLKKFGYNFLQGTYSESFDFNYESKNPTPREYILNPIDERVEIYSSYYDDLYDTFVNEAKKIFHKYNVENKCNPFNKKLTLMNDSCKNLGKNMHGGFECNENGNWSDKCIPFYCDIGYYYNTYKKECVKDNCFNQSEPGDEKNNNLNRSNLFLVIIIIMVVVGLLVLIFMKTRKKINKIDIEDLPIINKEKS